MTEFFELDLQPQLVQAVTERGYAAPMPIQSAIIPLMISGQDVVGQAQTGTGKTAAFALPILNNLDVGQRGVQALVLAPTRELALQVSEAMSLYGAYSGARVVPVYGGQSYTPQIAQLKRGANIVVGTPGRVLDLIDKQILDLSQVRTVVLDEADEMLSMGFIEDIEAILKTTPVERQTALFSATMPPEIRRLAENYMHDAKSVAIRSEQMTVEAIEQRYYLVNEADKTAALTRLFEVENIDRALIFARTRVGTAELANELTGRGFPAEALNGDLSQEAREYTLNRFRQNKITVLVATDVAARGLDIEGITHVFNYDLPDDPEIYVHRIGRTGRAGKTGIAISLITPFEKRNLRQVEAFARCKLVRVELPTEEQIRAHRETSLLNQVMVWLQRGRCRQERALVDKLVAEGRDPLDIAAVALKIARAEEKQRPIDSISEVLEPQPIRRERGPRGFRGERSERPEHFDRTPRPPRRENHSSVQENSSHEVGMVRLNLSLGRRHGIRPNDIVGAIAAHAKIPGSTIGKILIQDQQSLVDVPEGLVGQVIGSSQALRVRQLPADLKIN